jgi:hypothetical protein
MNTTQLLNNLTVADLLAAGVLSYFVNSFVRKAYSFPAQLFWMGVSFFGFYKIYSTNIPIVSGYCVIMLTIFFTVLPVFKRIYFLFVNTKNKLFFKCKVPKAPVQKFASSQEYTEKMNNEDKRKDEQHSQKMIYLHRLSEKLKNF